jgi:hypothetical protein
LSFLKRVRICTFLPDIVPISHMEKEKIDELKSQVESRLLQKITDLEAVKLELEQETQNTTGSEKQKNENLLAATSNLLTELRQAQINIHDLIQKNS